MKYNVNFEYCLQKIYKRRHRQQHRPLHRHTVVGGALFGYLRKITYRYHLTSDCCTKIKKKLEKFASRHRRRPHRLQHVHATVDGGRYSCENDGVLFHGTLLDECHSSGVRSQVEFEYRLQKIYTRRHR